MQPTLCARCHKNMAVVFINRIENGQSHQEGLCLKCARELHIKPIDDIISKMGINDEDLDGLSSEMMEAMQNLSGSGDDLMNIENDDDSSDDDGKTATFPFLNRLFGAQNAANAENRDNAAETERPRVGKDGGERKPKRKFLDNYCISLTDRARAGKLDRMIGRERGARARHPDPQPPPEEQPLSHRRAGRRQDGDRRGSCAAHRLRRRAGEAARQAGLSARPHRSRRRHAVPRPV